MLAGTTAVAVVLAFGAFLFVWMVIWSILHWSQRSVQPLRRLIVTVARWIRIEVEYGPKDDSPM